MPAAPHPPRQKPATITTGRLSAVTERVGMKLHNEFTVPLPPVAAWDLLLQVERVAPCFPGAKLLEVKEDGSFVGTVSLRLGPVALTFKGTASYVEVDNDNHKLRAQAKGNEARNRGTASADVDFRIEAEDVDGAPGSRVLIDTDLTLAGSIAQYARGGGMIEATAQVMIDDFAETLKGLLDRDRVAETKAEATPAVPPQTTETPRPEPEAKAEAPTPAPASKPPSLFAILWRAFKRWISGGTS